MVKITVTAGLAVEAGPTLNLNTVVEPDSYTVAQATLDAAGAGATDDVPLLPNGGQVALLALRARNSEKKPAEITVTPKNGDVAGSELAVNGTLFIGHPGALAALVKDGPRSLTLKNPGPSAVVVDILVALDS